MIDTIDRIAQAAHISRQELLSFNAAPELAKLRFIAMKRLRDEGFSYPSIGYLMNGRHHATAIHGVRRFDHLMATDSSFRDLVSVTLPDQEAAA